MFYGYQAEIQDVHFSLLENTLRCKNLQCKNPEIQLSTRWLSASIFLKQHGLNHLQFLLTFSNSHPDDKQESEEVMASTTLNSVIKYIMPL